MGEGEKVGTKKDFKRSDRRPKRRKKSNSSGKTFRLVRRVILLVVLVALVWVGIGMGREYFRKTVPGGKEVEITIDRGEGVSDITKKLKKEGLIRYGLPFIIKIYVTKSDDNLRYGTYSMSTGMSLDDIIAALTTGGAERDQFTLVIPEGYSAEMIAVRLEKQDIMSAEEFLSALENYSKEFAFDAFLPEAGTVKYRLQGYLFPDTYYLDEQVTPESLIQTMLANFEEHFNGERQRKAGELGMTVEEVLIRASLVQKETIREEEYPIVADVLQNRLDINMNLQLDSTVVYAMTDGMFGKERVYHSDLKYESPYNTYLHKGLPPGPICNPGIDAIDGVLNPDDNNYLFFQTDMSKDDGSNLYFETYEEHSSAQATTATQGTESEPEEVRLEDGESE